MRSPVKDPVSRPVRRGRRTPRLPSPEPGTVRRRTDIREAVMAELSSRSTREGLADHLRLADEGAVEEDLASNVAEDVVMLTGRGVFRGHEGVRELARQL